MGNLSCSANILGGLFFDLAFSEEDWLLTSEVSDEVDDERIEGSFVS